MSDENLAELHEKQLKPDRFRYGILTYIHVAYIPPMYVGRQCSVLTNCEQLNIKDFNHMQAIYKIDRLWGMENVEEASNQP